jgi:superfamily II DNA or RNA helicase
VASESSRKSKIEQLKQGHFKIVISTGQYFGEGIDLNNLECLIIAYPFAFEGKLIQYIGRFNIQEILRLFLIIVIQKLITLKRCSSKGTGIIKN